MDSGLDSPFSIFREKETPAASPPPSTPAPTTPAAPSSDRGIVEKRLTEMEKKLSEVGGGVEKKLSEIGSALQQKLAPAAERLEVLEKRLSEVASKAAAARSLREQELFLFLQARVGELEKALGQTQEKAVKAEIHFKEREEAQKKAELEMEDLLQSVQEQQRSREFEQRLREELIRSQARIQDLEKKLIEGLQDKRSEQDRSIKFLEFKWQRSDQKFKDFSAESSRRWEGLEQETAGLAQKINAELPAISESITESAASNEARWGDLGRRIQETEHRLDSRRKQELGSLAEGFEKRLSEMEKEWTGLKGEVQGKKGKEEERWVEILQMRLEQADRRLREGLEHACVDKEILSGFRERLAALESKTQELERRRPEDILQTLESLNTRLREEINRVRSEVLGLGLRAEGLEENIGLLEKKSSSEAMDLRGQFLRLLDRMHQLEKHLGQ